MIKKLYDLYDYSKDLPIQKLVVVAAEDDSVIEAVTKAKNMDLITPILIGNEQKIKEILNQKNYNIDDYKIIDEQDSQLAAQKAVELIRNNQADILMKGLLDTKVLLKAVVNKETGIRESKILSHITTISSIHYPKLMFASDCAMLIAPTVEDRIEIINNAIKLTKSLGYQNPKVGLVSAVEKVNPKIQSTLDAKEIINQYPNKDCLIDGPFAIDNLVSKTAAKHKGITSEVAGDVDILVFPNIESGNIFYKTAVFLGASEVAGIVIGAKAPIVLTSRADSSQAKLYSIILSAVYKNGQNNSRH